MSINMSDLESYISFTILRAIVQGWKDDAASNHGLALVNGQFDVGNDVVFNANSLAKRTPPNLVVFNQLNSQAVYNNNQVNTLSFRQILYNCQHQINPKEYSSER